jgi:hypothetical protein
MVVLCLKPYSENNPRMSENYQYLEKGTLIEKKKG